MVTVSVILFVVTGIGLLTSFSWQQGVGVRIRSAIWLGWFWVTVYVSTAHLFFAMKPPVALPLIMAGLIGWFLLIRKSGFPKLKLRGQPWWVYGTWAPLFALFILLSNQALRAPVYHSDAGWYRIPFITWIIELPAVPGLANLNTYFGYGHPSDVITGMLTSMTAAQGPIYFFSLLLLASIMWEILFRLSDTKDMNDRLILDSESFFILSALIALILITPFSSIWVSSPEVDVPTAALVVMGAAYTLSSSRKNLGPLSVGILLTFFAVALRPINLSLLLIILVFLVASRHQFRASLQTQHSRFIWFSLLGGFALISLTLVGNFIRTGYIFFPYFRQFSPVSDWAISQETLNASLGSIKDWGLAWTTQRPEQLSDLSSDVVVAAILQAPVVQIVLACMLLWLLANLAAGRRRATPLEVASRRLLMLGASLALLIVIVMAPDPRFAYGPLLLLGLIPLSTAWSQINLHQVSRTIRQLWVATLTVACLTIFLQKGYLGSALLNPVMADGSGPFGAHSPPEAVTETFVTNSGLEIKYAPDWLCWATEPPCTFAPNPDLELRGETLREGFRISR
jgi:hypothetical protein